MRTVVGGVVYHDDERVAAWVQDQLGGGAIAGPYQALGVENAHDELIFGMVFFNQRDGDIEIAMASTDMRPAMPSIMRRFLDHPFLTLGLPRLTAEIPGNNERCIRFAQFCGFQVEGVKRCADGHGGPVLVMGLLASECPFWRPFREGTKTATADQSQRQFFGRPASADWHGHCANDAGQPAAI